MPFVVINDVSGGATAYAGDPPITLTGANDPPDDPKKVIYYRASDPNIEHVTPITDETYKPTDIVVAGASAAGNTTAAIAPNSKNLALFGVVTWPNGTDGNTDTLINFGAAGSLKVDTSNKIQLVVTDTLGNTVNRRSALGLTPGIKTVVGVTARHAAKGTTAFDIWYAQVGAADWVQGLTCTIAFEAINFALTPAFGICRVYPLAAAPCYYTGTFQRLAAWVDPTTMPDFSADATRDALVTITQPGATITAIDPKDPALSATAFGTPRLDVYSLDGTPNPIQSGCAPAFNHFDGSWV